MCKSVMKPNQSTVDTELPLWRVEIIKDGNFCMNFLTAELVEVGNGY